MSDCEYVGTHAKQNSEYAVAVKRISGIYTRQILLGKILPLMFYYQKTRRSVFERNKAHHKCNLINSDS